MLAVTTVCCSVLWHVPAKVTSHDVLRLRGGVGGRFDVEVWGGMLGIKKMIERMYRHVCTASMGMQVACLLG